MSVKREFLGEAPSGAPVYAYHIIAGTGMEVAVLNFGATIKNIFVPDKNGNKVDVALGYDDLSEYFGNESFIGATVGPCANRTAGAKYKIDGKEFSLPVNDGPNNLHTDHDNGFHKRIWDAEEGDNFVKFTLSSPDGDLGFSGNREFELTYTLTDDNALALHYHATSDARTLINMTNHAYFNLSGHNSGSIHDHKMKLNASYYTPVIDSAAIPTGDIVNVTGTPFDFIDEKTIGQDIAADDEQLKAVGGYDHNFCIDGFDGTRRIFATVTSPVTGITMQCSTTLPGFQFYAGNFLKSDNAKGGGVYKSRDGFCLETQIYPNAVNEPEFPDPIFGPDREYDTVTVYQFM